MHARNAVERKQKLADLFRVAVKTWPFQTAEELAELLAIACDAFKEAQHTRLLKVFRSKLEGLRQERRALEAQRLMLPRQTESVPAGSGRL